MCFCFEKWLFTVFLMGMISSRIVWIFETCLLRGRLSDQKYGFDARTYGHLPALCFSILTSGDHWFYSVRCYGSWNHEASKLFIFLWKHIFFAAKLKNNFEKTETPIQWPLSKVLEPFNSAKIFIKNYFFIIYFFSEKSVFKLSFQNRPPGNW